MRWQTLAQGFQRLLPHRLNRSYLNGLMARSWTSAAGIVTVLFVARLLSPAEQGFFYTYRALMQAQLFLELGLTVALSVFVSHEFAHLQWGRRGAIEGDPAARARCYSIIAKAMVWFVSVGSIFAVLLTWGGLGFLARQGSSIPGVRWQASWVAAVMITCASVALTPLLALVMGGGEMEATTRIWLWSGIWGAVATWITLLAHGGLWAVCGPGAATLVVSIEYLVRHKPVVLRDTMQAVRRLRRATTSVPWSKEIWPLQWRLAISWSAGYFIYQFFVPTLFYYRGAVPAGQMGISLTAVTALVGLGTVISTVKMPEMGGLVAKREWTSLDGLFRRLSRQAFALVMALALGAAFGLAILTRYAPQLAARLVPATDFYWLLGSAVLLTAVMNWAAYLRAHKREPMVWSFAVGSVLQVVVGWYLIKVAGLTGACVGFGLITAVFSTPAAYIIFHACRVRWHLTTPQEKLESV